MGSLYIAYIEETLAGLYGRKPHDILCQVVFAGLRRMPGEALLKDLCAEVAEQTGKQNAAVYKALGRAVHALWEQGDRRKLEQLMGYRLIGEEPPLKELVTELIRALWDRSVHVEYRLLEGGLDHRVGISVREIQLSTGRERNMALPPVYADRAEVLLIVERWNREQMPLEQFRDLILLDQLRKKEGPGRI